MRSFSMKFIFTMTMTLLVGMAMVGAGESCGPNSVATVIATYPSPIISPDGFVWDGSNFWITNCETVDVFKLDPTNLQIIDQVAIRDVMSDHLAWDGRSMWASEHDHMGGGDSWIHRVDLETGNVVESFESPGTTPMGLTWGGEHIWSLDPSARKIYKHNPTTGEVLTSFDTPGMNACGLGWDGKCLWSSDLSTSTWYQHDPATGRVELSFKQPGPPGAIVLPTGFTWDGEYIWTVDESKARPTIYKLEVDFKEVGPCAR